MTAAANGGVEPFSVAVPDAVLNDLSERLERTRWPDQIPGTDWQYGTDLQYLRGLCDYWRDGYDWRKTEQRFNAWDQVTTEIDGQRIHVIHARSPEPDAMPLLLMHGWPGSVAEFLEVIDPLRDPAAHGGDAADAFHVVCPSLPGYGFSGPTTERGWNARRIARAMATLMPRLGYERYCTQGGDWGATVSNYLALHDPDHLIGIHLSMVAAGPPPGADGSEILPEEQEWVAATGAFFVQEAGYQQMQGTRPQTLAYGLHDSPAGLAGWLVEKFRAWSDCGGDLESSFTKDELLTNLTVYWVTQTMNSSARLYYEAMHSGEFQPIEQHIDVPTGCAIFPKDTVRSPRAWAEHAWNVRQWTVMPRGGHFPALEEPDLLLADVRAFYRDLRR